MVAPKLEAKIGSAPELLELADAVAAAVDHGKALRYAILGYAEVVGGAHEPVHQLALAHIARLEAIAEMVQRLHQATLLARLRSLRKSARGYGLRGPRRRGISMHRHPPQINLS